MFERVLAGAVHAVAGSIRLELRNVHAAMSAAHDRSLFLQPLRLSRLLARTAQEQGPDNQKDSDDRGNEEKQSHASHSSIREVVPTHAIAGP